jgi:starch synthase
VSDSYAHLFGDAAISGDMAHIVQELKIPVLGIPGGIDYAKLNPAIDPLLVARYDAEDVSQKGTCKTAMQRELGLELDLNCPLLFAPGPLTDSVGGRLIVSSLLRLLDKPLSLIVGAQSSDDAAATDATQRLAEQWPKRLALIPMSNTQALHRAFSAADFVLLTAQRSALESHHKFAQRYGALPIAIAMGVFTDSLVDCDAKLETGNAFLFSTPSIEDLAGAVARAITAWGHSEFDHLRSRTMRRDLGWERPTRRMVQVYRQVLGIRL